MKGIVAVATSMLTAAYHMLRTDQDYADLGAVTSRTAITTASSPASPATSATSTTSAMRSPSAPRHDERGSYLVGEGAEWWSSTPVTRDHRDLHLTDGGTYRCFREHRSGGWFVDGVYD